MNSFEITREIRNAQTNITGLKHSIGSGARAMEFVNHEGLKQAFLVGARRKIALLRDAEENLLRLKAEHEKVLRKERFWDQVFDLVC